MLIHVLLDRGQAIQIRQEEDDAVAGLFSQIGELYVVHHIWGKCLYMFFFAFVDKFLDKIGLLYSITGMQCMQIRFITS